MSASVASVTVAFNEAGVLPRQIDALLRQTSPLREIIVVDNGSTDGTRAMLADRYPQITVISIPKNPGGVGPAEAIGMAYAIREKHHDWVWTFDADSVPEPNTLELLLSGLDGWQASTEQPAIVAPLLIHSESKECYPPLFWDHGWRKPTAEELQQPVLFVDIVLGSGRLVRKDVVESVGLPRADLFMYFQDFEYCLRARAAGYNVAALTDSKLSHEVGRARQIGVPGFPKVWSEHAPWQEYYISRNLVYSVWHLFPSFKAKLFCCKQMTRHAIGVFLFSSRKLACLHKMAQGFGDGRRAILGPRFCSDSNSPDLSAERSPA